MTGQGRTPAEPVRIQQYLDILQTLMVALDEDGCVVMLNRAGCELLGYAEDEILGRNWFETCLPQPEGSEIVLPAFRRIMAGEPAAVEGFENEVARRDGTRRLLRWNYAGIRDKTGRIVGALGSGEDITEHKQTEVGLARSIGLLRMVREVQSSYIADTRPDPIFQRLLDVLIEVTESEFGFLDEVLEESDGSRTMAVLALSNISWDDASRALYEELTDRRLLFHNMKILPGITALSGELVISDDVLHDPRAGGTPAGHPPIETYMGLPVFFGSKLVGVAGVANRPQGYDSEMARFLEPYLNACGSIIHSVRRQEQQQRAEVALQLSESRFRNAFEHSAIGMALVSPEGKWLQVNKRVCDIVGYTQDELMKTFQDITHPDDLDADLEFVQQMLDGEIETYEMEKRYFHKTGHIVRVLLAVSLVWDEQGAPLHFISQIQDISARKAAEEALRENEANFRLVLEGSSVVVARIDTDLRYLWIYNPSPDFDAAAVIGKRDDEIADNEGTRRLIALQRSVIETGLTQREEISFPLSEGSATYLFTVRADASRLRQVLDALVTNAAESFGEAGGAITVTVAEGPAAELPAENTHPPGWRPAGRRYVCLSVADTGGGMTPEALENAFDPFFSTKFTGRGLGLPVVLGIVKAHEGGVFVESRPGSGTVVRVFLPLSEEKPAERLSPSAQAARLAEQGLVLVVEGEPALRSLVRGMLGRLGFEAVCAPNGAEAVEIFRQRPQEFRCVPCDLTMPEIVGRNRANAASSWPSSRGSGASEARLKPF